MPRPLGYCAQTVFLCGKLGVTPLLDFGVTCNAIRLVYGQHAARYVQLRMYAPQYGMGPTNSLHYAIRQLQIIGSPVGRAPDDDTTHEDGP